MMRTHQDILLKIVRCALWGTRPDIEIIPNWSCLIRLADHQTITGLIAEVVPYLPESAQPSPQEKLRLHSRVTKVYQSHALLNRKVAEVKSLMDANGISSVLFKGQGMALNYSNPLSRQCGDIDLYVGDRYFVQAMNLLEPDKEHGVRKYARQKHFNVNSEGVAIELHRVAEILPDRRANDLFRTWTVQSLEHSELRKVEIYGTEINLPPVDFDALYIMNHAWQHFMQGGIGLRQLCDWAVYLHRFHRQIDQTVLEENLKRFGLKRAWQIFASFVIIYLGLPVQECPLYTGEYDRKAAKVMGVIMQEGNFGKYSDMRKQSRPKGHFTGKLHSFRQNTIRMLKLMSVSPIDVLYSWRYFFVNGMRNVFNRI